MVKRAVASILWFMAIWYGYELAWSIAGVPRIVGPILAACVAGFVANDPFGLFWPRPVPEPASAPGPSAVASNAASADKAPDFAG